MADRHQDFAPHGAMVCEDGGYRFSFTCALCDNGYTTGQIAAATVGEALVIARNEARPHFNRCHRCGRWICDNHYNIDEMMCVKCAPHKEEHL